MVKRGIKNVPTRRRAKIHKPGPVSSITREESAMSNKIARLAGLAAVPIITLGGPAISGGNAFASVQPASVQTSSQVPALYYQDDDRPYSRTQSTTVTSERSSLNRASRLVEETRTAAAETRRVAEETSSAARDLESITKSLEERFGALT
jgi:hypothetical protein